MSESNLLKQALASAKTDAPPQFAKERALAAIAKATVPASAAASVGVAAVSVKATLSVATLIGVAAIAGLAGAYVARNSHPGPDAKPPIVTPIATAEAPAVAEPPAPARLSQAPAVGRTPVAPSPAEADRCDSISLADEPPTQCSKANGEPLLLELVNTCHAALVDVYWVNHRCKEVFYNQLKPGETLRQSTFANHPWRIRDHRTHRLVKEIAAVNDEVVDAGEHENTDFEVLNGAPIEEPLNPRCSEAGRAIAIDVVNRRADAVEMYWVDEDCTEKFKGRVEAGDHWGQQTQTAHRWHVRDAATHALLKDFAPDLNPSAQREYVAIP